MSNEMRDRNYIELTNQFDELHRDFREALDRLRAIGDDFSEGSQQRFMNQISQVSALRDQMWNVQQSLSRLDTEQ